MVVENYHSGEKSTVDAIEIAERTITVTHANLESWHPALRNKSDELIKALAESGGMLGFSMYPFHLKNGPQCSLNEFCEMIANAVDIMGIDRVGIGLIVLFACINWTVLITQRKIKFVKPKIWRL